MDERKMELEAETIADLAVAGWEEALPPHIIAEMRRLIVDDLMASDEGRAMLRRGMPDPVVMESSEIGGEGQAPSKGIDQKVAGKKVS